MNLFEASGPRGQPGHGFFGNMHRVVVGHETDARVPRAVLVQAFEQCDELYVAMAVLDVGIFRSKSGSRFCSW